MVYLINLNIFFEFRKKKKIVIKVYILSDYLYGI